jgi:arylsulfatase A-like enzyme
MNQLNSSFSALKFTFKNYCCLIILIILPLSFLYRIDSYLLLTAKQIILDTSIMVIFFVLLALFAALLSSIIYFLFTLFLKKEIVANIIIFYNILGFVIVAFEFHKTFKTWLSKILSVVIVTPFSIQILISILCIASVVFVFLFRDKIMPRLKMETDRWFKAVIVLVSISVTIIIFQISYTYFFDSPRVMAVNTLKTDKSESNRPNVILITFDALSAEDMSLYGYKLKTTPYMDLFGKESYVFKNMYANSNWTRPSVASILTGTYPSTHRLINSAGQNCFLPDRLKHKNIASILRDNGYQTAAIVSNLLCAHPLTNDTIKDFDYAPVTTVDDEYIKHTDPVLLLLRPLPPLFLNMGSSAHIWIYDYLWIYSRLIASMSKLFEPNKWDTTIAEIPELTFDLAYQYLKGAKPPFFLWIHLFPPHEPYLPGDKFKKQFLKEDIFLTVNDQRNGDVNINMQFYPKKLQPVIDKLRLRYDEHILYADHEFGVFINKLKKSGYLDTSIIIVSSDHGESFNHGFVRHKGPVLYNDLIHIPLIIHTPKQKQHRVIARPTEQIDIAPTILDLLNINIPPWMEGETIKKPLENKSISNKPKFSMELGGNNIKGKIKKGTMVIIKDKYKYIYYIDSQKSELYNIAEDPKELINLAEIEKERASAMRSLITRKI